MGRSRLELTGKNFGKLTVTGFAYMKKGRSFWLCLCECGKKTTAMGDAIKRGKYMSCGCSRTKLELTVSEVVGNTALLNLNAPLGPRLRGIHNPP